MNETTPTPIVVSENAGIIDTLTAAGRYLMVIIGTVPLLLTLFGNRDFAGIVAFFQGTQGASLLTALVALATLAYGLWKTHKRGAEIATVAASPKVPANIATTK